MILFRLIPFRIITHYQFPPFNEKIKKWRHPSVRLVAPTDTCHWHPQRSAGFSRVRLRAR